MTDIAIRVEGIGKKYKIGRKKSGELRESFSHFLKRFKRSSPSEISMKEGFAEASKDDEFWALKDISFDVKQGEAVGIIGRNGAGKSTLLKVLSRITKPTTGRFEINGRVSSLLEVGTGFHPELTGRENIYLNGTILGMRRTEIKAKFDEIIDFSGVEEFIDTPVKHYSSGMKVRLAFSVAAHLEPEILIIDEVLAVGDAEFQKKCLGKMEDVTGEGRTVLFVSHNMGAVESLCNKALLIEQGFIGGEGETTKVISDYLTKGSIASHGQIDWKKGKKIVEGFELKKISITQGNLKGNEFSSARPIEIATEYYIHSKQSVSIGIQLYTGYDIPVFSTVNWKSSSYNDDYAEKELIKGQYKTLCIIPEDLLNEDLYKINLVVLHKGNKVLILEKEILNFNILNDGNMRSHFHDKWIGIIRPKLEWNTRLIDNEDSRISNK